MEGGREVDVSKLNLQQLEYLQKQMQEVRAHTRPARRPAAQLTPRRRAPSQELQALTGNMGNLQLARNKFRNSEEAVRELEGKAEARILVPLTSSVYVPGRVQAAEKLLVDVGTGYYAEKGREEAAAYLRRKQELLAENMAQVQDAIALRQRSLETVSRALADRVQAAQAAQAVAAAGGRREAGAS
jgi:prefoldin alpha subunit